jgi:repressor LexA
MSQPERQPLTPRQQEALDFITANACLYGPTIREIAKGLGIKHHNAAARHVAELERKGWVRRLPKKSRGIEVVS